MNGSPATSFAPVVARLDEVGLIEHSHGRVPAPEFGHCTDDAGRALALAASLCALPDALVVAEACIDQLGRALAGSGRFVVRLDTTGQPTGEASSDDADARAIWGLAVAATSDLPIGLRARATELLAIVHGFESEHPRAAAQLVIAGTRLLTDHKLQRWAERLIVANRAAVPSRVPAGSWRWPEPRLTYSNGSIVEAMIDLAVLSDVPDRLWSALDLLTWLVEHETGSSGNFSFTPVGGRGPGELGGYDQQPIEAWALASACARASRATNNRFWIGACNRAAAWFDGANDQGAQMWDPRTGAAFDGLTAAGVNLNQGTESTLALFGTIHALALADQTVADSLIRSSR